MSLCKLLIACHKPAALPQDQMYIPIHAGRALALKHQSSLSSEDLKWMLQNTSGDDTGENISALNPHFSELTVLYWAWKNYDQIGNPQYIGLCHYRRYFKLPEDFEKILPQYDIISDTQKCHKSVYKQYESYHCTKYFDRAIEILKQKYPEFSQAAHKYLNSQDGFYYNMSIMKKELFFQYCSFLFDILVDLEKEFDYTSLSAYDQRLAGVIAERLSGIFISYQISQEKKFYNLPIEVKSNTEPPCKLKPAFPKNNIPICFSSDENYIPYLAAAIQSLIFNSSKDYNYDIVILEENISQLSKTSVQSLSKGKNNISIRFANIHSYLSQIDSKIFYTCEHFSISTYFRFFIPQIFATYSKVIYLDSDIIVNKDISQLYNIELGNNLIGASQDIAMLLMRRKESFWQANVTEKLKLQTPDLYFQAGVLVYNIPAMTEANTSAKLFQTLHDLGKPAMVDQDVLNVVCQGRVTYFENEWNFNWHLEFDEENPAYFILASAYNNYKKAQKDPAIIHYASAKKPWNQPELSLAGEFWKHARQTPFYETLIHRLICHTIEAEANKKKQTHFSKLDFWRYRILSKITFGEMRESYRKKYKKLKKLRKNLSNT